MLNHLFRRDEYTKKRRNQFKIKVGAILVLVVIIFVGLIFVSRMQRFRISSIEFTGGLLVSPEEIKSETNNFLSGYYFWFFPKNNILIYPRKKLENFLSDKFKRIDTISVSTKDNQSIKISITERGLYALWCGDAPVNLESEKCYFMDSNGVIFSESPTFSGDAYFKYYGFIPSGTNPIGLTYSNSSTEFHDLSSFVERVKNTTVHPTYLVAKDNNQFDLVLSDGGHIYIDATLPLSKTADNLESLLQTLMHSTTSRDSKIDYIDLRFGNKLFYKLK